MKYAFLTGKTVYLRSLEKDDLCNIKKWLCDEKVTKFLESGTFPPYNDKLIEQYENENKTQNNVPFLVVSKKENIPIGWAGLYNIDWIKRSSELRFFIGETQFWKMTAALETEKLLLEYAFEKLNMHKVTGGANVENKGSWKIIERAGFVKEGILRDNVYRNGKYYDVYIYSILISEYKKLYGIKSAKNKDVS